MKNTKAYGAEIQDELRETAPEYEKWRRRLFIMNCVIATGVFLLEIGVNIILFVQGKVNPDIVYHLMRYLVVPSGLVFLTVLVELTHREFSLLEYLLENKNIVMSRDTLLEKVCGYDYSGETNVIDVYVRYIRTKIDDAFGIKLISTVRGVGYVIKDEQ